MIRQSIKTMNMIESNVKKAKYLSIIYQTKIYKKKHFPRKIHKKDSKKLNLNLGKSVLNSFSSVLIDRYKFYVHIYFFS
jgi:hypothetical protein